MKCWNCQQVDMQPVIVGRHSWLQCFKCGASAIELPKPGHYASIRARDPIEHKWSGSPNPANVKAISELRKKRKAI